MNNPECARKTVRQVSHRVTNVSLSVIVGILQVILSGFNESITAQIIPDNTLGGESSVVTPDNINDLESDRISGGAVRGSNLFHSFQEFNIDAGKGAYFDNPAAIQNIFSRVTGSNPSNILGRLGVLGNANLFFLNPNGILFGENASLDIRGSFLATTADSILFSDGNKFSALNPEAPPLLTVNVQQPIGLELEGKSGAITNKGILEVDTDQNLALVGGDITLDGGRIVAPDGRVELGGITEAGTIELNNNSSLNFPNTIKNANISFVNNSLVDVRAEGKGSININAYNIDLTDRSNLLAGVVTDSSSLKTQAQDITLNAANDITISQESVITNNVEPTGRSNSGGINITTSNLFLTQGGLITTSTFGQGNSGAININASNTISIDGVSLNSIPTAIASQVTPTGRGNSGGINLTTANLSLTQGGRISTTNFGQGNRNSGTININASNTISIDGVAQALVPSSIVSIIAPGAIGNSGGINITTSNLFLTQGGRITTSTFGQGNAGAITINALNTISADGVTQAPIPSSIVSQVAPGAIGDSGVINLKATNLFLTNGSLVSTTTFGRGDAAKIIINVSDTISVDGEDKDGDPSVIASRIAPGAIGDSGGINITTGNLFLSQGGAVGTDTFGIGNTEEIVINASDTISANGTTQAGVAESGIFSIVQSEAQGNSKRIKIDTNFLFLDDKALVSARTEGEGEAGDIFITVKTIEVTNNSQIQTNTTSDFDAGDIILNISDKILFSGNETGLFAQTTGAGTAGDIKIDTPQLTIDQGASISAFTEASGDSGTITMNAPQSVLLKNGSQLTVETSAAGKPGEIYITTPNLTIGKDSEISATATETSTNTEGGGSITINTSNLDLTGKLGIFAETQGLSPAGTLNLQPYTEQTELNIVKSISKLLDFL